MMNMGSIMGSGDSGGTNNQQPQLGAIGLEIQRQVPNNSGLYNYLIN